MADLRSICPFDCPDACGLSVHVEGGVAVKVRGDPAHPYSQGTLCPKMNGYERSVHSPARLTTPLVRTGPKGKGEFRRASWDEAIRLVADGLRAAAAEHGGEAILPYSYAGSMGVVQRNAGFALFHALGASRLERSICTPAQDAAWTAVMGATAQPGPDALERADLVVVWGANVVATNIHLVQRLKDARRRGARVVLVELYRHEGADLADEVLVVRPGSDGALALAAIHVLARDGMADEAFLAREAVGWPELRARALAEWSPAWASPIVGLPPGEIERFAHTLAKARAPTLRPGGGPSRHGNGAANLRAVVALSAVLGAPGRPGGGCWMSTSSSQAFDLSGWQRPDLLPRPVRTFTMNGLGDALRDPGGGPPVRAMYVWCSNPAAVAPDQNAVLAGLAREDLFLAVHERFLTDTARFADVVLPATSSLEHADLYRSYGHYTVQRVRPVVRPVGESLPNLETVQRLARALGLADPVFSMDADAVITRVLDDSIRTRPDWWRGVDRAAFDAGEPVVLAPPPRARRADGGEAWGTPSGRIELVNPRHASPLPGYLPSHAEREANPLPLRLVTAPALHTLNSTFQERPELRERNGVMPLLLGREEAGRRGLADGGRVVAWNALGEVAFRLVVDEGVPPGVAVAPGVAWLEHTLSGRNVNALTSQRLTDEAFGSTFYDNRVDIRPG
ncbi:MAG: molybdopterin oxidoreductase family protein [Anaeromyxobacter sp.]